MYVSWLGKYGLSRIGVYATNTKMLEELDLDDTRSNRKWIMNKFRVANPKNERFQEEYGPIYEAAINTSDVDKIREEQIQRIEAKNEVLGNLFALLNSETLSKDFFDEVSKEDRMHAKKRHSPTRNNA